MRNFILSVLTLFISCFAMAEIKVKEIKTDHFSNVNVSSIYNVYLIKSSECKVVLTFDEELEKYLDIRVKSNTLHLGMDHKNFYHRMKSFSRMSDCILKAEVYLSDFEELEMSGSSRLSSDDEFQVDDFKGDIGGASRISGLKLQGSQAEFEICGATDVNLQLKIQECRIDVSGSSDVKVTGEFPEIKVNCSGASNLSMKGSSRDVKYECSGASRIKAADFIADYLHAEVSGAANVTANITQKLTADLSGASSLFYYSKDEIEVDIKSIGMTSTLERKN